ncbi:putative non-specific serine/threonine protein kinase [Helianthus anomalus]
MEEGIQSQSMIHERLLSTNVLLDEKWNAKIARFRLSKFESQWSTINTSNGGVTNLDMTEDLSLPQWEEALLHPGIARENDLSDVEWNAKMDSIRLSRFDSQSNTINTSNIGGRDVYLDSKHLMTENANVLESIHIYSLGVILFEMLTGRLSNDPIYMSENANVLESIARKHLNEGTLNNVVDPRVMEEAQECGFTTRKGPGQDSFDTFSELAYQCLVEPPSKHPTLKDAIKSLEKALHF